MTPPEPTMLRLSAITYGTRVNGPGVRTIVHLQGCAGMQCAKVCFNKHTHDPANGFLRDPISLAEELAENTPSGSYTVSGGEPFQQTDALAELLVALRRKHAADSIVIFTGYHRRQLAQMAASANGRISPHGLCLLGLVDVLVAGPYNPGMPNNSGLRSSRNQELVFVTGRHTPADFDTPLQYEIILYKDGTKTITGFPPEDSTLCQH